MKAVNITVNDKVLKMEDLNEMLISTTTLNAAKCFINGEFDKISVRQLDILSNEVFHIG